MALLVLHHDHVHGLGTLAESLAARDREVRHVTVADGAVDLDGATGVLVLGGRAPDAASHDAEVAALAAAVEAEVPVLAVGGGAEALAEAVGATVEEREVPEASYLPLHRTAVAADDDVAAGWPDGARALALHDREATRLPDDAEQLLIGSDGFSLWRHGTALVCRLHLLAGPDEVAAMLATDHGRGMCEAASVEPDELAAEATHLAAFTKAAGLSLVLRWVDGLDD